MELLLSHVLLQNFKYQNGSCMKFIFSFESSILWDVVLFNPVKVTILHSVVPQKTENSSLRMSNPIYLALFVDKQ
jgi:hypothetical protein